jgi:hypothetical protein
MGYFKKPDSVDRSTSPKIRARNIKNTLIYTQLVKMEKEDAFYSAAAKTADEAKNVIESGFEYVCTTPEETMIFHKRK